MLHLINDIRWAAMAFLNIHRWCLWPNWGRRIHEKISIKAWFCQSYLNFHFQVRRRYMIHKNESEPWRGSSANEEGTCVSSRRRKRLQAATKDFCQRGAMLETISARKTQQRRVAWRGGKQKYVLWYNEKQISCLWERAVSKGNTRIRISRMMHEV